jgi:hypothetical protein
MAGVIANRSAQTVDRFCAATGLETGAISMHHPPLAPEEVHDLRSSSTPRSKPSATSTKPRGLC